MVKERITHCYSAIQYQWIFSSTRRQLCTRSLLQYSKSSTSSPFDFSGLYVNQHLYNLSDSRIYKLTIKMKMIIMIMLIIAISTSIEYKEDISQQIHKYCLITHCNEHQWTQWNCKLCSQAQSLQDITYIENKITQIMAVTGYSRLADKIIVIFRGTIDVTNWLEDLSYKQVQYKNCAKCLIHQGFYLSFLSVADQIYTALKKLSNKYPQKQLLVTGSSLGASLATIAAIEILTNMRPVAQLHTFGSPRVGNAQFAMYVKSRIPNSLRVVHNRDIVPHVPLESQNYHHIPYQIFFNEDMSKYRICNQNGEDSTCSNSLYPNYTVQDHISYWTNLDVKAIC